MHRLSRVDASQLHVGCRCWPSTLVGSHSEALGLLDWLVESGDSSVQLSSDAESAANWVPGAELALFGVEV